ncbi:MAG: LPS export ABC transporter permease LptF [Proteobacteria bacterium]|nr:MAG: LPS export ABC transporter permease LptF [Pseudomonadota bacterium]
MKVVERYILRRAFMLFIGAMAWTLAIVWTTQVLARIDLVTDSGQSALTFFEVASLIIPSIIPIVVPFAVVVAVAQTLSVMNSDSELVVINAAGASRMTVLKPIMLLAVAAAIFCLVVQNFVDPYARQRNRNLIANARADFLTLLIQEGTFRKIEDGLFVQIGKRFPGNKLGEIFVADSRQEGVDLVYYAKTGAVIDEGDDKALLMSDGVVHRKVPGGEISIIRFTSYAFDLSAFTPQIGKVSLMPKDQTTPYLLNPDPNDRIFQKSPNLYRTELAKRFSEWLYPITFALIALAVAGDARSHRESRIHPLITAVSIALLARWVGFFAEDKAKGDRFYVYVMAATPIVVALIAVWFIRAQRAMELPTRWADVVLSLFRRIRDLSSAVRLRIAGGPSHGGNP